jgi:hypothetical protein
MKKKMILLLLVFIINTIQAQKNIDIRFLLGTRIHTNIGDYFQRVRYKTLESPIVGVEFFSSKIPFSLSYQLDSWIQPQRDSFFGKPIVFGDMIRGHVFNVYWSKKNYKLGLGYYQKVTENALSYVFFPTLNKYKGMIFSFSVPFDGFDVEFRRTAYIKPSFSARGINHQNLAILYRFKRDDVKDTKDFDFNILGGTRLYFNKGVKVYENERISPVGLAPCLGFQFLYKPWNLSIDYEKDWLLAMNIGSIFRAFKQYRTSSFIAAKYHHHFKNERTLAVGAGAMFVTDFDLQNYAIEHNQRGIPGSYSDIKGIGLTAAYELFKNTYVESRYTIPMQQIKKAERAPNISLGLIYKYNRINNKK